MIEGGTAVLLGAELQASAANVPPLYVAIALIIVASPIVVLLWLGARAESIERERTHAVPPPEQSGAEPEYLDYREEISYLRRETLAGSASLELSPTVLIETAAEQKGVCVMKYSTPINAEGKRLYSMFAIKGIEFVRDLDGAARCAAALAAFNSSKLNIAFTARSVKGSFEILVSIIEDGDSRGAEERRLEAEQLVRNSFPGAQIVDVESPYEYAWSTVSNATYYGLITGIPSFRQGQLSKIATQLGGADWFYTVVSYPVERSAIERMLLDIDAEIKRVVEETAWIKGSPAPLEARDLTRREPSSSGFAYISMLRAHRARLEGGLKSGAWNAVLYFGAPDSGVYQHLKGLLLECQTADSAHLEPLRAFDVFPTEAIQPLLLTFNHPFVDQREQRRGFLSFLISGPRDGRPLAEGSFPPFPSSYETLLTSAELRAYANFPNSELPGFGVEYAPKFEVTSPTMSEGEGLEVGSIYRGRAATGEALVIPSRALSKQTLIVGDPDSGINSLVFSLVKQLLSRGGSFHAVDPSGRRFRNLRLLARGSQVYTVGSDSLSPLAFNPLWVPPERSAWEHISFIAPAFQDLVPEIPRSIRFFEGALERLYRTHGWDMDEKRGTTPTVAELRAGINRHFEPLGIPKESTWLRARIREGLTRLLAPELGGLFSSRNATIREAAPESAVFELWPTRDDRVRRFLYSMLVSLSLEEDAIARESAREGRFMVLNEPSFLMARTERGTNTELAQLLRDHSSAAGGMLLVDGRPSALDFPFTDLATVVSFRLASMSESEASAKLFQNDQDIRGYLPRLDQNFAVVRTEGARGNYLAYVPKTAEEGPEVPDSALKNLQ